jgi:hypothetical protein
LADELRVARPALPVIDASGYTANVIAHHGVLDDGIEFLEKPFTPRASVARAPGSGSGRRQREYRHQSKPRATAP